MKKSVIIAFVIAVLNFINVGVLADSLYSKYDFLSDTISIKGSFDNKKEMVLFVVLPLQENIEELTAQKVQDNKYLVYQTRNESDGSFETKLQMPTDSLSGEYKVYVFSNGKKIDSDLVYINKQDDRQSIENIVKDINRFNGSQIAEILKEKGVLLGMSAECIGYADTIAAIISNSKPTGGYNIDGFFAELNRSSAIVLLKNGHNVNDVMWLFGENFDNEAQTEITNMGENHKDTFSEYIKKNMPGKDTKVFFYRAVLISYVKNAKSYTDLEGIINKYKQSSGLNADTIALSVNDYKTLFNKEITTFPELESTIKYLSENEESTGSGTGGFGVGAGGGGGGMLPSVSSGNDYVVSLSGQYLDIKGHWCEEGIKKFVELGIVSGYTDGTFKPDKGVTRAEFVKLLVSALNLNEENITEFEDVTETDWYFGYIGAGVKNGLVSGYGNTFRPNDMIKRQDAAVIIWRALNVGEKGVVSLDYQDADRIAGYALDAISILSEAKILSGDGVNFNPEKGTTRAEAVVMIDNMLNFRESGEVE